MALAKTLVALGTWIEKHFPTKITAGEVYSQLTAIEESAGAAGRRALNAEALCAQLAVRVAELEKQNATFTSDMNKTKIMLLTQRQTAGR